MANTLIELLLVCLSLGIIALLLVLLRRRRYNRITGDMAATEPLGDASRKGAKSKVRLSRRAFSGVAQKKRLS